jgi:hypothetical protein
VRRRVDDAAKAPFRHVGEHRLYRVQRAIHIHVEDMLPIVQGDLMETGGGALTLADGILVVDAKNGATTTTNVFSLGNRVAAGAFEYGLFHGGLSSASLELF